MNATSLGDLFRLILQVFVTVAVIFVLKNGSLQRGEIDLNQIYDFGSLQVRIGLKGMLLRFTTIYR